MHDRTVLRAALLHAVGCGLTLTAAASAAGCSPGTVRHLRRTDPEFDRLLVAAAARSRTKGRLPERVRVPPPAWESLTTEETDRIKAVVLEAVRSGRPLREVYPEVGITFPTLRHLRRVDPEFNRAVIDNYYPRARRRCSVSGCPATKIRAKGLCSRHYYQRYRTGRTTPGPQTYGRTTCTVPGCGRPHRAKGYCTRCYERHVRQRRRARNGN